MSNFARPLFLALTLSAPLIDQNAHGEALKVGATPSPLELKGDDGGLVKGDSPWSSSTMRGKTVLLLYVDPDESELNNALTERLKKENFDHARFDSVAVINMDATWKPNAIISSVLKGKQKDYPNTTYVKDYKKVLVKNWDLGDDNFDVVLFDPEGKVLFRKDGKLTPAEIDEVVSLVRKKAK